MPIDATTNLNRQQIFCQVDQPPAQQLIQQVGEVETHLDPDSVTRGRLWRGCKELQNTISYLELSISLSSARSLTCKLNTAFKKFCLPSSFTQIPVTESNCQQVITWNPITIELRQVDRKDNTCCETPRSSTPHPAQANVPKKSLITLNCRSEPSNLWIWNWLNTWNFSQNSLTSQQST